MGGVDGTWISGKQSTELSNQLKKTMVGLVLWMHRVSQAPTDEGTLSAQAGADWIADRGAARPSPRWSNRRGV